MNASILVIDDDKSFQLLVEEALSAEGFEVRTAGTLARGLAMVNEATPDVVILDRRLPDGDGIYAIEPLRAEGPAAPLVLVATAYGDVENAVEALRAGAWNYLTKPVQLADLVVKLHKALETRGLRDRLQIARSAAEGAPMVEPTSASMRAVVDVLRGVAASPLTPVLFTGPSGSGKQRAAELLHELTFAGGDQEAPFMQVNCAAFPDELIENELFGHEKSASVEAKTQRGLIEMAAGGTLFLDEVTAMPLRSQAKLLKFLDSLQFRRLGGRRDLTVELRIVCAATADIRDWVRRGSFREDLHHRLSVFAVAIPPLVERKADIPDLAQTFMHWFAARVKKRVTAIAPTAMDALLAYGYPGNVRELRNILERAVILSSGSTLIERDLMLPRQGYESRPAPPFFEIGLKPDGAPPQIDEIERAYVGRVLEHCHGHRTAAAHLLGISYPTFLKRLRELGFEN